MNKKITCPVCQYNGLNELPFSSDNEPSHEICPCCGFEFGFDGGNDPIIFKKFYQDWKRNGAKWFLPKKR